MNELVPKIKDACRKCGAANPEVITFSDTVDFRGMELDVENLQESKCRNCGYTWVTSAQRAHNNSATRAAYGLVRDELRQKHGMLTGHDIAQIRNYFGLNQRDAAALFGGGYNAFNKYESGEVLQSYAMDRLLRLSAVVGTPAIDFLKDVFSPPRFFVISVNRVNDAKVEMNLSRGGYVFLTPISGTSQIEEYKSKTFNPNKDNEMHMLTPKGHEILQIENYEN